MKKWTEKTFQGSLANLHYLSRTFNIDPFIMKILFSRGITSGNAVSKFLFPSISDFHDPFLLNDMKPAIQRTIQAIRNNETIVIFGDYDVDGITSTSIMKKALDFFKSNVHAELPLREHGYGITVSAIERLQSRYQPSLIITVDNGSNAHEAMRYAKEQGIDVIVTDHHEILDYHPSCYAFINPKRSDNRYPFTELSGAGVAFKFVHALFSSSKYSWEKHIWDYVELACLGTIADMMQLVGENRIMASLGIQKLNVSPSPVFQELFHLLSITKVESETIGFSLAPIFNSVGRIDDPNIACSILCTDDTTETTLYHLIETNKKRKWLTFEQTKLAETIILQKQLFAKPIIVVAGDFHDGIIGIIAARITNKYKKPSIVISKNGKGSARSVGQFSIINTIERCAEHLKSFGGHQGAAGLSISLNKFDEFSKAIERSAQLESSPVVELFYDETIPFEKLPLFPLEELSLLEPFGMANPKPVFHCPNLYVEKVEIFGRYEKHAKIYAEKKEALLFMEGLSLSHINGPTHLDLLYSPSARNQVIIQDFSFSASSSLPTAL